MENKKEFKPTSQLLYAPLLMLSYIVAIFATYGFLFYLQQEQDSGGWGWQWFFIAQTIISFLVLLVLVASTIASRRKTILGKISWRTIPFIPLLFFIIGSIASIDEGAFLIFLKIAGVYIVIIGYEMLTHWLNIKINTTLFKKKFDANNS